METPPPIVRGLIDTPILIEYRDGLPDPLQFITAIRQSGLRPEFSQLSTLAMLVWCQDQGERIGVATFLATALVHPLNAKVASRSQRILEALPPPSALTADDAIVAATAVEHKLALYTLDPPKFAAVAGLTTIKPY